MADITELLVQIASGEGAARDELIPLVYSEMHQIATAQLHRERAGHTLDATSLVHEAYMRLLGSEEQVVTARDRQQFMAVVAVAMRRILVDHARSRLRLKRGGNWERSNVDLANFNAVETLSPENLLSLHEALNKLNKQDPTAAELIEQRFFAQLTMSEVAENLDISLRTAQRIWAFARTWLFAEIEQSRGT
ncbi:ECF-type sigma factor [Planctomycetaceae bacterium SH139]